MQSIEQEFLCCSLALHLLQTGFDWCLERGTTGQGSAGKQVAALTYTGLPVLASAQDLFALECRSSSVKNKYGFDSVKEKLH